MVMLRTTAILAPAILGIAMLAPVPAHAQDTDTAAERARLANERIRLEAQRRAEEERRRQQVEEQAQEQTREAAAMDATAAAGSASDQPDTKARSVSAPGAPRTAAPPRAAGDDRISRALEQLRELGELRDAGYVTEEEFERIKARIIERRF